MIQSSARFTTDDRARRCAWISRSMILIPIFPRRPSPPAWPSASCRSDRLQVAARLAIPAEHARAYLERSDAKFFYCITRADAGSGADWHARMQFYSGEDPATGSASGCAIAYLVRHGLAASGQPIVIEQGIEMLRPSRIHVSATIDGRASVESVRRRPHHSRCNGTLFPAVMHPISTGTVT